MDGPEAIRAGVATADDHHVFSLRGNSIRVGDRVPFTQPVLLREVVNGEMDAGKVAPGNRQIPRRRGSAAEDDRIEITLQGRDRNIDADIETGSEDDAFLLHQRQASIEQSLLELEL